MKVKLGDCFSVIRNGASIKQSNDAAGIPITRIETISDRIVDRKKLGYANVFDKEKYQDYYLQDNDLLMSHINSEKHLGKTALYKKEKDEIIIHGMNLLVLRTKRDKILPEYALYFFSSAAFSRQIVSITKKSVNQASFNVTSLKNLEIFLPTIKEQLKIANRLKQIDKLIGKNKLQLEKMDQLVKSRFIEMFGDPETNPHDWEITTLSTFCDLQNGYAFKSSDYVESSSVLNCRMSNIRPDGGFDDEYNPKFLPDEFWDRYADYRLADGDVIIAMTDMASDPKILGVPTIVRTNGKRFLLNQRVGKLSFYDTDRINKVYLMFVLSQKHIRRQLEKSAGGSTQINVGKSAILGVRFFVPPLSLQTQFADFVAQVDKSKLAIQKSLEQLETLKKSLMQEYFG